MRLVGGRAERGTGGASRARCAIENVLVKRGVWHAFNRTSDAKVLIYAFIVKISIKTLGHHGMVAFPKNGIDVASIWPASLGRHQRIVTPYVRRRRWERTRSPRHRGSTVGAAIAKGRPQRSRGQRGLQADGVANGALLLFCRDGDGFEHPFGNGNRRLRNGARLGSITNRNQRIVDSASSALPRRYLGPARRDAGKLGLVHVPDFRINPNVLVEVGVAVLANIQYADLRPAGMNLDVEVVGGGDALTVHNCHVLGADGNEVGDADVSAVAIEQHKRLLALLRVDAGLTVRREPRVEASGGDEDVLRTRHNGGPGLIAAVERVVGSTVVRRVTDHLTHHVGKRSRRLRVRLVVRRFGLDHASKNVG